MTVKCKRNTLYILSCLKNDKQVCKKIISHVILALGWFKNADSWLSNIKVSNEVFVCWSSPLSPLHPFYGFYRNKILGFGKKN